MRKLEKACMIAFWPYAGYKLSKKFTKNFYINIIGAMLGSVASLVTNTGIYKLDQPNIHYKHENIYMGSYNEAGFNQRTRDFYFNKLGLDEESAKKIFFIKTLITPLPIEFFIGDNTRKEYDFTQIRVKGTIEEKGKIAPKNMGEGIDKNDFICTFDLDKSYMYPINVNIRDFELFVDFADSRKKLLDYFIAEDFCIEEFGKKKKELRPILFEDSYKYRY